MDTGTPPRTPSDVVNPDVVRANRLSLAGLLGIGASSSDDLSSAPGNGREEPDPPYRFRATAHDGEETRMLHDDDDDDEGGGGGEVVDARRAKEKVRQKLFGFNLFRRRKADRPRPRTLFGRVMLPSVVPDPDPDPVPVRTIPQSIARATENPFEGEHAIVRDTTRERERGDGDRETQTAEDEDDRMDTHQDDGDFPSPGPSPGQWVTFPSLLATPPKGSSSPTTPKRSPRSVRSKRTTPGSAKSWLSELSNASELSTMSSLRRKSARRKARLELELGLNPRMRSMQKSVQILGQEAAGAVVRGTSVSPNKLRYIDVGRQMREYMRRLV